MKKIVFILLTTIFIISLNAQQTSFDPLTMKKIERKGAVVRVFTGGTSKLLNGLAEIKFEDDLKEFGVTDVSEIKVVVTPINTFSGLYVTDLNLKGFKVKSEIGDKNAEFSYIVFIVKKVSEKGDFERIKK